MFVWDAHVAFVGFTLQTTIDGINSSFKTQPGHLLWEASLDYSELNKAYSPLCHIIPYPCFPNCCNLDSPGNTFLKTLMPGFHSQAFCHNRSKIQSKH